MDLGFPVAGAGQAASEAGILRSAAGTSVQLTALGMVSGEEVRSFIGNP